MGVLSTDQILERATAPGGALAHIREQAEAEAQAEADERAARRAEAQAAAEATLSEARQACRHDEETYFKLCSRIPALQAKGRASRERYKAAQRVARDLGVTESDPLRQLGTGSYEHRKQAEAITLAFRRGL